MPLKAVQTCSEMRSKLSFHAVLKSRQQKVQYCVLFFVPDVSKKQLVLYCSSSRCQKIIFFKESRNSSRLNICTSKKNFQLQTRPSLNMFREESLTQNAIKFRPKIGLKRRFCADWDRSASSFIVISVVNVRHGNNCD